MYGSCNDSGNSREAREAGEANNVSGVMSAVCLSISSSVRLSAHHCEPVRYSWITLVHTHNLILKT